MTRVEVRKAADQVADPREILALPHADVGYLQTLYWRRIGRESNKAAVFGSKAARRRATQRDASALIARAEAQVRGARKRHEQAEVRAQEIGAVVGALDQQIASLAAGIAEVRETLARSRGTADKTAARARTRAWKALASATDATMGSALDHFAAQQRGSVAQRGSVEVLAAMQEGVSDLAQKLRGQLHTAEADLAEADRRHAAAIEEAERTYATAAGATEQEIATRQAQRTPLVLKLEHRLEAARVTRARLDEAEERLRAAEPLRASSSEEA